MKNYLQLPNILTLIRLVVAPLALPLLLYYLLPYGNASINTALAVLFILFNLTDFFDGYFARRYKLETKLGELLDPLADKFLLVSVMISLVALKKLFFYWAIIFISRDFWVMGLRLVGSEQGFSLPVSKLAKIKTALVMLYLTFIIARPTVEISYAHWAGYAEWVMLLVTLLLTLWTAGHYSKNFLNHYARMAKI